MSLREKIISVPVGIEGHKKLSKLAEDLDISIAEYVRNRLSNGHNSGMNDEIVKSKNILLSRYEALITDMVFNKITEEDEVLIENIIGHSEEVR